MALINLKQIKGGQELEQNVTTHTEEIEALQDADIFKTDITTVNSLGGIPAGTDLNGLQIQEVLTKLLYPYVAPTVSANSTPNGGTFEKGSTQNVTNIRAVVGKKSEAITKVEVFDGSRSLGVKTDGIATGGNIDFPVTEAVTTNKNFTVKVTDASNKQYSANTGSFNFVYPYYMGVVAEGKTSLTGEEVKALTKKVEGKGNKTHSFTCANQRMVFAYPKSYGALKSVIDPNNFDVTGTFGRQEVQVECLDGSAQDYYVYINSASTVTNFAMKFNY